MRLTPVIRNLRSIERRFCQARMTARMIQKRRYPVLAHIIPVRRCNLSCAYCNEYDNVSKPVPTAEMLRRIDLLAALGAGIITFSGGEPLLHPDLDEMIRRIRKQGDRCPASGCERANPRSHNKDDGESCLNPFGSSH
jgi:uncharacterized radical SAM superfamily Fe-S cluster-containing enzyme